MLTIVRSESDISARRYAPRLASSSQFLTFAEVVEVVGTFAVADYGVFQELVAVPAQEGGVTVKSNFRNDRAGCGGVSWGVEFGIVCGRAGRVTKFPRSRVVVGKVTDRHGEFGLDETDEEVCIGFCLFQGRGVKRSWFVCNLKC